jgi:CRISPR system Cascade subunit CasC
MKLIELHILQSFPVSCLNRDDVGAPKTAVFGGANRARISSQCMKRAIRELAKEEAPTLFAGNRSRLIITPLADALLANGLADPLATDIAKQVGDYLATADEAAAKKGQLKVKTLMFLSPAEVASLGKELSAILQADPNAKIEKAIAKACKAAALKDAADIAIFGRMVASDHSLTLEGAGMFSHALSTHKADNDLDFFSAVDDLQSQDEAGAGFTDTLEFTSATYYRYAALNLGLLQQHLRALSQDERKTVVKTFISAAIQAVPGARRNSMNANTLPCYVLGLVKDKGQPLQLINAFERPIVSKNGIADASVAALKAHHEQMKATWGINPGVEVAIPDVGLDAFCERLTAHVG